MLNERDYMRNGRGGNNRQVNGSMSAVKMLIVINVIAFIMQSFNPTITAQFSLVAAKVQSGEVYRLFTSMFLHGGFFHILFNMWGLFLFGSLLEDKLGKRDFLIMYFVSGLTGSALWMAMNWGTSIACIGASGAVFGVIITTAMFFPNVQLMLMFPPMPLKLKTFAFVYILIEIYSEFSGAARGGFMDNVAHIVHLGGALGGYLYIKITHAKDIVWDLLPGFGSKNSNYKAPSGWSFNNANSAKASSSSKSSPGGVVTQNQLDTLLDKISKTGINSLTEDEMKTLRVAREQMQGQ